MSRYDRVSGDYGGSVGMFRQPPREIPDMRRLVFLRWLVERGKLEHWPSGPSRGEFVFLVTWPDRRPIVG